MKLSSLTSLIRHLEPVAALRANRSHTRVFGLLSAARPAVTAALADGPMVVVTAHPQAAQELMHELPGWTSRRVELFPAIESLPYERVRIDPAVLAQRRAVARDLSAGNPVIAVAPVRALLQPVQGDAGQAAIEIAMGGSLDPTELLRHWVEGGYAESALVEEPGTFARRGGVLDVFPVGAAAPIRVELFGNEIESLRSFDPATQRSLHHLESATVAPISTVGEQERLRALEELLEVDTSSLRAEAQTRWLDDLARLEAGAALDEVTCFAPYLAPAASLIEHLTADATVVIDDAAETWNVMAELWEQSIEVQRGMEEAGDLPAGLRAALITPDSLRERLTSLRQVEWMSGSSNDETAHDWSDLFAAAPLYAGRLRSFAEDTKRNLSRPTVIASQQAPRLEELLREEDIGAVPAEDLGDPTRPGVSLVSCSMPEGWYLPTEHVMYLTDHEIFGRARTRPIARRRPARAAFFADFAPGDHVVHVEHGIGRFDGITRMSVDGSEREYALIQYQGADRVYVPTEQLERLTRYIGAGEAPPALSKLGGGEWQRARSRARKAAEDIARELVDLYAARQARPGHAFGPDTPWQHELESAFPYAETPDQIEAVADVKADMEQARPMDRLVTADVGYGKTEVSVRAAFKAVMDGKQAAVLVPTTILAQQHFETFSDRLAPFPVHIEVLSRFKSPAEQRDVLQRLASGEVDIVIGTHRLLQKDVRFKNLGLLVIDEEQRFGVKHKERLKQLRENVDVLTLTATPIPRTLHMTLVGIREVSVIETAPEGRRPIKTHLQPHEDRLLREAIIREMDRDGQVYMVHNKVASIGAAAEKIRRLVPEARVVVAHGQMEESHLERIMYSFAHHQADVLVCSTIIENGLDIPNVNTIIVSNAHTLGLTQLYQLRGRVGRSANQAYAYLLYPRDARLSHDAARRLEAVFEAQDLGAGFNIAMRDLEIRGAGNLLGAEQSGQAAAIGFDLYTRMVGEAVDRLRGIAAAEPTSVSIDLPLTMFLPAEYVGNEQERLTLYRRLAAVGTHEELDALADEIRDRFGPIPVEVENLILSVRIKLDAIRVRVNSVVLSRDALVVKAEPSGFFDRISLYRRYGSDARISNNTLRIPRRLLGESWVGPLRAILDDMIALRENLARRAAEQEPTPA